MYRLDSLQACQEFCASFCAAVLPFPLFPKVVVIVQHCSYVLCFHSYHSFASLQHIHLETPPPTHSLPTQCLEPCKGHHPCSSLRVHGHHILFGNCFDHKRRWLCVYHGNTMSCAFFTTRASHWYNIFHCLPHIKIKLWWISWQLDSQLSLLLWSEN